MQLPLAVVTLDTERLVTTSGDLAGKRVAVHDHAGLANYLSTQLPDAKIVDVSSQDNGLEAVQNGKVDALVGPALSVEYAVVNKNLRDLILQAKALYLFLKIILGLLFLASRCPKDIPFHVTHGNQKKLHDENVHLREDVD